MASIKKRKSTFSVIYWYLDNAGERKQKWDTLETKKEAKQRKAFVEYYQEKYGYVIVPLEEQFARQIDESKKELDSTDEDITLCDFLKYLSISMVRQNGRLVHLVVRSVLSKIISIHLSGIGS